MDDLNIADDVISTPLFTSARKGESDVLCQLLEKGHDVNLIDNRGWTPLHEAVAHGHLSCVRLLLQHEECDVNALTNNGMSPMYVACQFQNNLDLIKVLIEHGVNSNIGDAYRVTPLHVVSTLCKLDVLKELVKHGVLVNAQDFNKETPLMKVIRNISTNWDEKDENHKKPLEIVRFLLDNGASVTSTDIYGHTAFFIAARVQWNECVQLLLECGSDVNHRITDGYTALFVAAESHNLSLVRLLLDRGAATDAICDNETMPLHHALHYGYTSVAEELIKKMNIEDIIGRRHTKQSFLMFAIGSGSFESFKLVMDNKLYSFLDRIPVNSKYSCTLLNEVCFRHYIHQTPLSFILSEHIDRPHTMPMLKYILDSGAFTVNARNEDFIPPLVALINSFSITNKIRVNQIKLEFFHKLLEEGANIDYNSIKNCPGSLPIPDAIMAVMIPNECSIHQNLLLPVLAHCFACNWDDLFDWLVKYQTCSAAVLNVLIRLGTKSKHSLLEMWKTIKQCPCCLCKKEFPSIQKLIYEKDTTLQSLSRARVRDWLWQKTCNSNEAAKLLHEICVPLPVQQYIIPVEFYS